MTDSGIALKRLPIHAEQVSADSFGVFDDVGQAIGGTVPRRHADGPDRCWPVAVAFRPARGTRSTRRPGMSPSRRSNAVKRNRSMRAAGSNSAARSTSLAASASPRATEPNRER